MLTDRDGVVGSVEVTNVIWTPSDPWNDGHALVYHVVIGYSDDHVDTGDNAGTSYVYEMT